MLTNSDKGSIDEMTATILNASLVDVPYGLPWKLGGRRCRSHWTYGIASSHDLLFLCDRAAAIGRMLPLSGWRDDYENVVL